MARTHESPEQDLEFIFRNEALSSWLRRLRTDADLSLRQLEALSGVSDSEIFRIESGIADCRLDAFVSICAALGIPAGWVIDTLSGSNLGWFAEQLRMDADFRGLADRLSLSGDSRSSVLVFLCNCCVRTAMLLRCSSALRRARSWDYPSEGLKSSFLDFAARLDGEVYFLERAGILQSLKRSPVAELRNQRLLSEAYCLEIHTQLQLPRSQRKNTSWMPPIPSSDDIRSKK